MHLQNNFRTAERSRRLAEKFVLRLRPHLHIQNFCVAHWSTGALWREAHDALLAPLLLRLQQDDDLKKEARAALERVGDLPWNARSVRSFFLRRVGVVIAKYVGSQLARAKWRGREALRCAERAASSAVLQRRPSGLAGPQRVVQAAPPQPLRAAPSS